MNVFELDQALVNDYERFARSFTLIRAPDIKQQVEELYASDRFWPEPLVSINPRYELGASIDQLVACRSLHEATAKIFSVDGKPLPLYRHQAQAVAKATARSCAALAIGRELRRRIWLRHHPAIQNPPWSAFISSFAARRTAKSRSRIIGSNRTASVCR